MTGDHVIRKRVEQLIVEAVAKERLRWTSGDQPSAISEAVLAERERCSLVAQFFPVETWSSDLTDALRIRDAIGEAIRKGLKPTEPLT